MESEQAVEKNAEPVKERAGIKLAAVVALAGGVLAGLWGMGLIDGRSQAADEDEAKPVACQTPRPTDSQGYAAVCAALNRSDLPALLGTPDDRILTAHPMPMAIGTDPMVEVRLRDSAVAVIEGTTSVDDMLGMPQFFASKATVLGHPAAIYSSKAVVFGPADGKDGKSGLQNGPGTRNLIVAEDAKASGGRAVEIDVFRRDGGAVDDATMYRLAEKLLPTMPGWVAGS
ncbi:hypothetical protein VM98_08015 [Streptomyces rubellomurinus subsp. indigoferus]|nr:hypothetical protein VM98_08015 [Streptomyces rubellomurinus subsp. indigoferus]